MEKLNKYILAEIICNIGSFYDVIRLCRVCKRWKKIISEYSHNFTLQGTWSFLNTPSNIEIDRVLKPFEGSWKLNTLDLRSVKYGESIYRTILNQPQLLKIDLSNTEIGLSFKNYLLHEKKKENTAYQLEELRMTNNRRAFGLDYGILAEIYPNLKRLYIGNTGLLLKGFIMILTKFKKLQLLDISLSAISPSELDALDFRDLIKNSALEKLFITDATESVIGILNSLNVQVITKTIGEVLLEVTSMESLYLLEDWISLQGDVNLRYDGITKLSQLLSNNPHSYIIQTVKNDNLLYEIFRLLIASGLDLSFHSGLGLEPPLINTAVSKNHLKLLQLFISSGHDIYRTLRKNEELPIILATLLNNLPALEIFVEFKLQNIEIKYFRSCTPLCVAATQGHKEVFLYLYERTSKIISCQEHSNLLTRNTEIAKMVFSEEYKKRFHFSAEIIYDAAHYFVFKGNEIGAEAVIEGFEANIGKKEIKILEKIWKDPLQRNSYKNRPLIISATEKGLVNVVISLTRKKFNIDLEDDNGKSAFMIACLNQNIELITILRKGKAKVDKRDRFGRTALHLASEKGMDNIVHLLIELGAGLNLKCSHGLTPFDYADTNFKTKTRTILTEYMKNKPQKCIIS